MTQIVSIRDFEKKLLEQGLLVSKKDEDSYTKDHGLFMSRLENGLRILMAQRTVLDERVTYFDFHVLSGSYFDPPGRDGAHHLMEHLFFSKELNFICDRNLISYNASTSQSRIHIYNNGIYNLKNPKFGVLNGIAETAKSLESPVTLTRPEVFAYFKDVIYKEISEHMGNYQSLTYKAFYRTILEPENPYSHDTLGTVESVRAVTAEEIREIINERIVTENMMISALCDGQGKEAETMIQEATKLMKKFPRTGKRNDLDLKLYSKVKKLPTNKVITAKTPINNKLVTLFHVWTLDVDFYSEEESAFLFLTPYLRNKFFNLARDRGLGYSLDLYHMQLFPNKLLFVAYLVSDSNKQEEQMEKFREILYEVLNSVNDDKKELEEILEIEHNRQAVTPISQQSRLQFSLSTLIDFDLLTNNEAVRKLHLNLTTATLGKVLKNILEKSPAKLAIGDL